VIIIVCYLSFVVADFCAGLLLFRVQVYLRRRREIPQTFRHRLLRCFRRNRLWQIRPWKLRTPLRRFTAPNQRTWIHLRDLAGVAV